MSGSPPAPPLTADLAATPVQDEAARQQSQWLSQERALPPGQVPGYEIERLLGEGSYGSVWLAHELKTGKRVAIKFYTRRRGLNWSLLSREVEKLAMLYTSRNIVRLIDVGWHADPPYYVMEYLERGSLEVLLREGPLEAEESVRIIQSVCQALVHAHGRGVLHCDLKPANVLLDANMEPRLCDFGQSRLSNEQNPALGTLFYMAPEQADLSAVPDACWDVYALGALLYHLLVGRPPFRTPASEETLRNVERLDDRLAAYRRLVTTGPRPREHWNVYGVDRQLAEIIDRCLRVDPNRRYA
ncbi:MAG: serine/threonine protein kinase, partial [Planctomycetaceae bacterium]|nr:serine/threonine protein kinase [Planctomycetaceae bacterium]